MQLYVGWYLALLPNWSLKTDRFKDCCLFYFLLAERIKRYWNSICYCCVFCKSHQGVAMPGTLYMKAFRRRLLVLHVCRVTCWGVGCRAVQSQPFPNYRGRPQPSILSISSWGGRVRGLTHLLRPHWRLHPLCIGLSVELASKLSPVHKGAFCQFLFR